MTALTDIDGVGPAYAEELEEAGYNTAEDVASADADTVDDVLASADGAELVQSARAVADGESSVSDEESDSEPSETSHEDADDDLISFAPDFNVDQRNHLISALVDREINARRTNQGGKVESIRETIDVFLGEEPYRLELDQISTAYTAINQHEQDLRSQRGIAGFISEIRAIKNELQEVRSRNWPE